MFASFFIKLILLFINFRPHSAANLFLLLPATDLLDPLRRSSQQSLLFRYSWPVLPHFLTLSAGVSLVNKWFVVAVNEPAQVQSPVARPDTAAFFLYPGINLLFLLLLLSPTRLTWINSGCGSTNNSCRLIARRTVVEIAVGRCFSLLGSNGLFN